MNVIVRIYRAKNLQWAFRVKKANGKIVLSPAETYKTRQGVRLAVERLAAMSTKPASHGEGMGNIVPAELSPLAIACRDELAREARDHG